MIFERIQEESAKTEYFVSIFDHGVDTYHVVKYILSQNPGICKNDNLVKLAALVHDVGKLKKDFRQKNTRQEWYHAEHTREFLVPLLEEKSYKRILKENNVALPKDLEALVRICERHHAPDPPLLRDYPEAILVSAADAIASMMEAGVTGNISDLLRNYPYSQITLALVKASGFNRGLDVELHKLDLPSNSVEDALLATAIYQSLSDAFQPENVVPVIQRKSTLWVMGNKSSLLSVVKNFEVNPQGLYDHNFSEEIYETILQKVVKTTGAGGLQADQLRFVLLNEPLAKKVSREILLRETARKAFEKAGFSLEQIEAMVSGGKMGIMERIRYAGRELAYLITGPNASYHYHRWRSPVPKKFFLKIYSKDIGIWRAYLRSRQIFASTAVPGRKETAMYDSVVLLGDTLTPAEFGRRHEDRELFYISPEDLVVDLLKGNAPPEISDAAAIIYVQRKNLNWELLAQLSEENAVGDKLKQILKALSTELGAAFTNDVRSALISASLKVHCPANFLTIAEKIKDDLGE